MDYKETKNFLAAFKKMCTTCRKDNCQSCPFVIMETDFKRVEPKCTLLEYSNDTIYNKVVKWIEEHPFHTYLDDFLEKYPKAELAEGGCPDICVMQLYPNVDCNGCDDCVSCWKQPMEDIK